jgi:hypothetical protein
MDINEWFNPEFINTCLSYNVEPQLTGNSLRLYCPKAPPESIKSKILKLIPSGQPAEFIACLSSYTRAAITVYFGLHGAKESKIRITPGNGVVLDARGSAGNSILTDPENPVYGRMVYILKQDPYTEQYIIRYNGLVMVDSGVPNNHEVYDSDLSGMDENPEPVKRTLRTAGSSAKATTPVPDDRFDYDREFLPKDVGTDVRILLESTSSVEDFLKAI